MRAVPRQGRCDENALVAEQRHDGVQPGPAEWDLDVAASGKGSVPPEPDSSVIFDERELLAAEPQSGAVKSATVKSAPVKSAPVKSAPVRSAPAESAPTAPVADPPRRLGEASARRRADEIDRRWDQVAKPQWQPGVQLDSEFAVLDQDGLIRLYDTRVGDFVTEWSFGSRSVDVLCFAPDGSRFVAAGSSGELLLRAVRTQSDMADMRAVTRPVVALAWHPDGELIAAGRPHHVTLHRLTGEQRPLDWTSKAAVTAIAFSPSGRRGVAATADGLQLWADGRAELLASTAEARFSSVAVTATDLIVAGLENGELCTVTADGAEMIRLPAFHQGGVSWVGVADAGQWAMIAGDGRAAILDSYDADPADPTRWAALPTERHWVSARWVPGRRILLAVDSAGHAAFFDPTMQSVSAWMSLGNVKDLAIRPVPVPARSDVIGDGVAERDELGFLEDATAIAHLIASERSQLPLSLAILGEWGSGKSSLLKMVGQEVERLAVPDQPDYAEPICQVWFNAWHYSDDQVWTGLVEQLFRSLAPPEMAGMLAPAELADQQRRLHDNERIRDEAQAAITRIEGYQLDTTAVGPLDQPRSVLNSFVSTSREILTEVSRPRRLVSAAVAVLLLVLGVVGVTLIGGAWGALMVSAPLVGIVTAATWAWGKATSIWKSAAATAAKLDADRAARKAQLEKNKAAAQTRIDAIAATLRERTLDGQFRALLAQLGSDDRYAAYRGLSGRVQRDLEDYARLVKQMLSEMAKTPAAGTPASPASGPAAYRRIVLYIDDLDRCRADRVVEVLQAINLLSTTGLFVVVAAIEPGWVLQALTAQHARQITGADKQGSRALQFLDKLFPIAIAVRPMGTQARTYLATLLGEIDQEPRGVGDGPSADRSDSDPSSTDPPGSPPVDPGDDPDRRATASGVGGSAGRSGHGARPAIDEWSRVRPVVSRISPDEAAFLPMLSGLLPGPRAAKRFANVYRLLHAGLGPDDRTAFLRSSHPGGAQFQAAALLLAGVVGWPEEAQRLIERIRTDPAVLFDDTVDTSLRSVVALRGMLAELAASNCVVTTVAVDWADSARLVARYSVATYRSYASSF